MQEKDLDVLRVLREKRRRPGLGILESPGQQQHLRRLYLCLAIVRQRVGRADVLGKRGSHVVQPLVGFGQLESCLAELRIELDGAGVFDDGKLVALFSRVLVAALQVPDLCRFRVAAGRGHQRHETERAEETNASFAHEDSNDVIPVKDSQEAIASLVLFRRAKDVSRGAGNLC